MKIDVHQHLWSEPLVESLAARSELPFVRSENGLSVLYIAGDRPYVIDRDSEQPRRRADLVHADGLDRALICLSSPLGIERLARRESLALIDAYHEGALALGAPFGVWGAIPLDRPRATDVDRAIARGCIGVSIPAGALADVDAVTSLQGVLARLEQLGAPLLVHPGPGRHSRGAQLRADEPSLGDPLWWPALTRYVSDMQASWLAFQSAGRPAHPSLRVVFAMLAGLAPLQLERLRSRGGRPAGEPDPLTFYETSSYGPLACAALESVIGEGQILYGSDRPVVDPSELAAPADWDAIEHATELALGAAMRAGRPPLAEVGA